MVCPSKRIIGFRSSIVMDLPNISYKLYVKESNCFQITASQNKVKDYLHKPKISSARYDEHWALYGTDISLNTIPETNNVL